MIAKNRTLLDHGYAPDQHVFGRVPKIPAELQDEQSCVVARSLASAHDGYARAQQIRVAAREEALRFADVNAFRRSQDAVPRPVRPYGIGDPVCYWRHPKGEGRRCRPHWATWDRRFWFVR